MRMPEKVIDSVLRAVPAYDCLIVRHSSFLSACHSHRSSRGIIVDTGKACRGVPMQTSVTMLVMQGLPPPTQTSLASNAIDEVQMVSCVIVLQQQWTSNQLTCFLVHWTTAVLRLRGKAH